MALEDRFRKFADEHKAQADRQGDPYERNVKSMQAMDSIVSEVLKAFCRAVGWSLKRSDCCDRDRGAVSCSYILEHPDHWREGYLAVDVEMMRGYRSDPVEAATVYEGRIVGTTEHARDFASRVAMPFSGLTEDGLATVLEQQSVNIIRRIIRLELPPKPTGEIANKVSLEDRFRRFYEAEVEAEWDRRHREAYERNLESLKKAEPMVSKFLQGYCSALGWSLDRRDDSSLETGVVSCCYRLSPPDGSPGHVDVWVSVTAGQGPEPQSIERVEVEGETGMRTLIPFSQFTEERLAAALTIQCASIITRIGNPQKLQ